MKRFLVVCTGLMLSGCGGQKSTADWIELLQSVEPAERLHAVNALCQAPEEAQVVVPALVGALKDGDPFVRRDAARALGQFGPDASSAVPALLAAAKDRTPSVRKAAAAALKKIGQGAEVQANRL